MWYWLSTKRMTIGVRISADGIVQEGPPIVRKFIGQPLRNLTNWLQRQGDSRWAQLAQH